MFGYVRPVAQGLSAEEVERFHNVYCALCHTLGKRYGFAARFLLNYDFTFLAILLFLPEEPRSACRRCVAHPVRGCMAMESASALDTAADYSVILAWWQLRDHIADHGFFSSIPYRFAALLLRGAYRAACSAAPEFDDTVRRRLSDLNALEKKQCASLDMAADPFAALLADISSAEENETRRRILRQILYHLGRWIYLIDAADDFKKDARSGNYNPLRLRYNLKGDELPEEVKRELAETLDASVRSMASAYVLLESGVWSALLDNIFYVSFYTIGASVLSGAYHKPSRLRRRTEAEGKKE